MFPELEGGNAFAEVAATLDVIERLAPQVVVPGHGPVFTDVQGALERARNRLAAYVANPARHAAHAGKVLLKFKLLEVQRVSLQDLLRWAEGARYLEMVRSRWFPEVAAGLWISSLVDDLVRSGAAARDGEFVLNA